MPESCIQVPGEYRSANRTVVGDAADQMEGEPVSWLGWHPSVRVLALLLTAFFFAAAVLQVILMANLTGNPPAETQVVTDNIMASFQFEYDRWPIELTAQLLFALGFLALGGIGILLSRLAAALDERRSLAAGLFVGTGLLGAASSLVWIGVKPVATFPHYCPCDLRDAELAARVTALDVGSSVSLWLTIGAILLASGGFLLIVGLGARAGMSRGWTALTYVTAAAGLLAAVLGAFDVRPASDWLAAAAAGLLIPIWALWLAIRAPKLSGPGTDGPEDAADQPMVSPPVL
jgi:hypothetical protein